MKDGKKVGFTAGAFDLCHAGHMLMFEEAKGVCDYLIVGLHSDPTIDRPDTKNRPIMSVEERKIILNSVRWIDEVVVYDTEADLLKLLTENPLNIDVRILGVEYKEKPYTGEENCRWRSTTTLAATISRRPNCEIACLKQSKRSAKRLSLFRYLDKGQSFSRMPFLSRQLYASTTMVIPNSSKWRGVKLQNIEWPVAMMRHLCTRKRFANVAASVGHEGIEHAHICAFFLERVPDLERRASIDIRAVSLSRARPSCASFVPASVCRFFL